MIICPVLKIVCTISLALTLVFANISKADCDAAGVTKAAAGAGSAFDRATGELYGTATWTDATGGFVPGMKWLGFQRGYNSCAFVASAILDEAGCGFGISGDVNQVAASARRNGWKESSSTRAGCLVIWNSLASGNQASTPVDGQPSRQVSIRHIGIALDSIMTMENTSYVSRPTVTAIYTSWKLAIHGTPTVVLCPGN
jgi:hypothetical protein